MLCKGYR